VSDVIGAAWASLSLPAEPTQATQESADARSGLVDALRKRWKEIRGEPDDTWKQREEALLEVQFKEGALSGIVLEAETKQTLMVRPPVTLAQLHGMYFDTDKCFLLPTAAGSLKRLVEICAKHAGCEMLIVGHTDTAGKEAYNLDLSADRADAFKAYLRDDVDAWLAWYKAGVPASKRWGGHEDSLMIDALVPPDCVGSDGPIAAFQEWHNGNSPDARQPDQPRSQPTGWAALKVDGIMGPLTRRQLIIDYMNLDGTSLEPDTRVVTYGCGEFFPLDSVEGEVDESAKDGEHVQFDRRVEVFLFDQPFGILPPVPGVAEGASSDKASKAAKGDKLYPEWRIRSVRKYTIGPGGVQPEEGDLWLRIAVAPVDAAKLEETFVLKSTDGSVVAQKAASKDYEANDEGVDLHFEGLDQGESYTLEVHGDDGLVVVLFKNVAYAELANQAGSGDEPDQPEDVGEEFGEAESVRPSLSGDTVLA
jgi:outer membrane protein OmpA-like peptidoglycan-associated protein